MDVKKININQTESTYYIASDIYDVSAHNNGATFESLSALLGSDNLSTLIPSEIRCGGMTIRFIQSSDNKYVQYRLMSATWSTTISDWQGVDDEPTVGSDNLVKSGAVADAIEDETTRATTEEERLQGEIDVITNLYFDDYPYKNIYYKTSNLNIGDVFDNTLFNFNGIGTFINSLFIYIKKDEEICINNLRVPSAAINIVLTDKNNIIYELIDAKTEQKDVWNIIAKEDGYLHFSSFEGSFVKINKPFDIIKISELTDNKNKEIETLQNKLDKILFDDFNYKGMYYDSNLYGDDSPIGKVFDIFRFSKHINFNSTVIFVNKNQTVNVSNVSYGSGSKYSYLIDKNSNRIINVFSDADFSFTSETDCIFAISTQSKNTVINIGYSISKIPQIETNLEGNVISSNTLDVKNITILKKYINFNGNVCDVNNEEKFVSQLLKINRRIDTLKVSLGILAYGLSFAALPIAFYDSAHVFIAGYSTSELEEMDCENNYINVPMPLNSQYVRIGGDISENKIYVKTPCLEIGLAYSVEVPFKKIQGQYVDSVGKAQYHTLFYSTEFIKLNKGNHYFIDAALGGGSANISNISFYKERRQDSFISSVTNNNTDELTKYYNEINVPKDANYIRICSKNDMSDEYCNLYTDRYYSEENQIIDIACTRWLDIPINRVTDIYVDNIINMPDGYQKPFTLQYSADDALCIGRNQIRFSPTETGNSTLLISVFNDVNLNDINNYVFFQTRRIPTNIGDGSDVNICVCGDSLVDGTAAVCNLYKLLNEDGDYTINQIGTRTGKLDGITYLHEGRGSWTWESYVNPSYETEEYNNKTNAFMINGELNFIEYINNYFPDLNRKTIDYFIVSLGTNDVQHEYTIDDTITRAKLFIDTLLSSEKGFPNCKIIIGLPAVGAPIFKNVAHGVNFKRKILELNQAFINNFDNGVYNKNVTCVMHGAYIDRYNGYLYEDVLVNDFTQDTERVYTNNLHPSVGGYKQWSKGYYGKIRALMYGLL